MFQEPGFRDAFRVLPVYFRVIGFEEDPERPTRPRLIFAGEVRDGETMIGRAEMTPDEHLRWKWVRLRIGAYWRHRFTYKFSRCVERAGRQSGGIFYPL
jgi:hypothetical protein